MARKFGTAIDLQQFELLRAVLQNLASDPSSGKEGQVYWNSSTDKVRVCTVTGSPGTWANLLIGPIASADIADGTIMDIDVNAAAAIGEAKLNLATDAAPGTGSRRTLGTGANQAAAGNHRLDQHTAPTAAVAMGSQKITGLADPTAAQDAATKAYVDATAQGLDVKKSVRLATTAPLPSNNLSGTTLSGAVNGVLPAIDGVPNPQVGWRILVKDEAAPAKNGIYEVNSAGSAGSPWILFRTNDADTAADMSPGSFVFVEEGTTNADSGWVLVSDETITLGTTAINFTQFTGAGMIQAGTGLTKTGNTIAVSTVPVANGGTGANTAPTARTNLAASGRYTVASQALTAGAPFTVSAATHGLGANRFKVVKCYDTATNDEVEMTVSVDATGLVAITSDANLIVDIIITGA